MEKVYNLLLALLKGQFGRNRSIIVDDTTRRTNSAIGYTNCVEAVEDTVFTELTLDKMYEEDGSTLSSYYNGATLLKGEIIYGTVHAIQLSSGAVRLHMEEDKNVR